MKTQKPLWMVYQAKKFLKMTDGQIDNYDFAKLRDMLNRITAQREAWNEMFNDPSDPTNVCG